MVTVSPLRYPGGKAVLYNKVKNIISCNNLSDKVYVEPFAGGYGLGIKLMLNHDIKKFIINDYDFHIYAFWKCLFNHTEELISFIRNVNVNIDEWRNQKNIYLNFKEYSLIDVGCATLFLNRTNHSGVLKGGPIGGISQAGKYKIDCRFNKESLIKYIEKISAYRKQVKVYNLDVKDLIKKIIKHKSSLFFNFDPPYVTKGKELYENFFNENDHIELHNVIKQKIKSEWIMTYDDHDLIKELYKDYHINEYELAYFAGKNKKGKELFISNFPI